MKFLIVSKKHLLLSLLLFTAACSCNELAQPSCTKDSDCKSKQICTNKLCSLSPKEELTSSLDASPEPTSEPDAEPTPEPIPFEPIITPDLGTPTPFTKQEVLIPSGSFLMGMSKSDSWLYPMLGKRPLLHKVTITKSFYMWKHEVTQGEFQKLMNYNTSKFVKCGSNCPVEKVNWSEATAFCNAASATAKLPQCYDCKGNADCKVKAIYLGRNFTRCKGYRLPTEAEWEYAYRAGTTTTYYNGKLKETFDATKLKKIAWFVENANKTKYPVKLKLPNKWGLYDMSGNVWEWVHDWYNKYPEHPATDPVGPKTPLRYTGRVIRGGSWKDNSLNCRAYHREFQYPTGGYRENYLGFRPVRTQ